MVNKNGFFKKMCFIYREICTFNELLYNQVILKYDLTYWKTYDICETYVYVIIKLIK